MASYNRDYMGGAAPPPGSVRSGFSSPWRAYRILIVLNVAIYLLSKTSFGEAFLLDHALVSLDALKAGRVWTLLLGGFFHLDAIHLILTMGFVYVLGWRVEQEHGPGALVGLYLLGSLTVGVASLAVNSDLGRSFDSAQGPVSTGTGFFVAEGLVLTNAHVVGTADELEVELEGETTRTPGRVRARSSELDLALVEVSVKRPVIPAAVQRPPVGRAVFAYGYGVIEGDSKTQLMTSGRVSGFRNDKHWLVFDASVNPGNSGGPLVDAAGRWVAVVTAKSVPLNPGEDARSLAIEGGAVQSWLATHGVSVETEAGEPKAETPPAPTLGRSVLRLIVRGQAPLPARGQRPQNPALALDPWIFGASGAFLAMAGFVGLADPRRNLLVFGNPVPLLVIVGFGAVADMAGALRTYNNFHSWAHLYHLGAVFSGMVFLKLYEGKLKAWLEARRQKQLRAQLVVHRGGGGDAPIPGESKLSLADRARLDRVLEKVSRSGLDSLSAEERAFLDEASGKLRGE